MSAKAPQTQESVPMEASRRRSSTVIEGEVFGARLSESLTPSFANSLLLVNDNLLSCFSELRFLQTVH